MSQPPQAASNGWSPREIWNSYIAGPIAGALAIIPVFYGFEAKSDQQLGKPIRPINLKKSLIEGRNAAPIIGIQMAIQNVVEKALMKQFQNDPKERPPFAAMLISSMIVGFLSTPPLAIFNGKAMGQTPMESLKALSRWQTGAIVARETSFLFSLRIIDPIKSVMKRTFGDNKATEYGSAFIGGGIGSLIGHPADTALTLWQKEMKIESLSQTMRGAPVKAITVAVFAVLYKMTENGLKSPSK
jgi:hypothetical protein